MLRRLVALLAAVLAVAVATSPAASARAAFPATISLPQGFQPEGIAAGRGTEFFVGSIPTGAIYRGDFRTGAGEILVPGRTGRAATGVGKAGGRLFVAGAGTGKAFVYDATTGDDVAVLTLTTAQPAFINDVVVTRSSAFFTDSFNPVVYRVDRRTLRVETVPLSGDIRYGAGFNVNGIDVTPNGRTLVLVQSNTGKLFRADADTGTTREIRLRGEETVPMGDGILLAGRTLYVVQNRLNVIAAIRLNGRLTAGTVVSRTGDPRFDVPTTIARFGHRLYAVNARFGTPSPGTAEYSVVGIPRPKAR